MVKKNGGKRRRSSDSSPGQKFLKIFIFPCEPSGEVYESKGGGGGGRHRDRNSGSLRAAGQECALPRLMSSFHNAEETNRL